MAKKEEAAELYGSQFFISKKKANTFFFQSKHQKELKK